MKVDPTIRIRFEVYGEKNYQREYRIRFFAKNPMEGDDGREDFPDKDILDIELGV